MAAFYFFKTFVEHNESGQRRIVLHPLDGQHQAGNSINASVESARMVQLCRPYSGAVTRLPVGSIVGVCHEGRRYRDIVLREYTRNDIRFYRTEAQVYVLPDFISPVDVDSFLWPVTSELARAPQDMFAAYCALTGQTAPGSAATQSATQASQPAAPAQAQPERPAQPQAAAPSAPAVGQAIFDDGSEIEAIEERFDIEKALFVSRLRDRMHAGIVKFVFRKQTGSVRTAWGTRNGAFMNGPAPTSTQRDEQARRNDGSHFVYWDIQRQGFRSFCIEDLITVELGAFSSDVNEARAIAATPVV